MNYKEIYTNRWGTPNLAEFARLIYELSPDIWVIRNPSNLYGLISVALAKYVKSDVIFYTQGEKYRYLSSVEEKTRQIYMNLTGSAWITPVLGDPENKPSPIDDMYYVPFVMPARTNPKEKVWFRDGNINILCVARFFPRKNHSVLLKSINKIRNKYDVKITFVGKCTTPKERHVKDEVKKEAKKLDLNGDLNVKINVPPENVHSIYKRHDVFVLPSRSERAAVSNLEAMSHSLPVICTDSNGTSCYIQTGRNGYIAKTDCVESLAKCMEKIIYSRENIKDMGKESHKIVKKKHDPESYVQKLTSIVS
jgi:glycosyltransferase involved in cell wall biosynthesis